MPAYLKRSFQPLARPWREQSGLFRNLAFLLVVVTTLYFGIFATPKPPAILKALSRPDLLLHFLAFGACAFVAPWAGCRPRLLFVLLVLLAAAIELIQFGLNGRTASFSDFFAGTLGVGIGCLASQATSRLARLSA